MKPLDVLRGLYVRSPRFVRDAAKPLVALVPTSMKFGKTYARQREQIAKAAGDPHYAHEHHLSALRALLAKAHRGSPFYRDRLDEALGPAFDLSTFTLADLRRLPILDKDQLRAAGEAALAVPRWQLDSVETSGSNRAAPLSFFLDKDRSPREMAFVYDAWSRVGFTERDARASLRGFHLGDGGSGIHDWDPALRELKLAVFPMTGQDVVAYLDEIDRRQIRFLYGYPSAIELLCRRMQQIGRTPRLAIKGILPISEPLYDHQRSLIRRVLGDVTFGVFYGLSEKVAFAAEVPGNDGLYEFNPLYGVAELVDENGTPVTEPGHEGRVIGTGFLSTGMPFIRYDTGDFGTLVEAPTSGNGERLRIRGLAPRRKPGFLISFDGHRVVALDLTPEDPAFFKGIAEYQFYQDTPGNVVIRYILDQNGSASDVERLSTFLTEKCRGSLAFRQEAVSQIVAGRGGKRAFIDQRLDITQY